MIRSGKQTGYILLPVIVVITLVAAIALLMNTESALESNTAGSELDAQQARYVAEAGLNHALWLTQQQGCGPYSDLTDAPLGSEKYSSILTTDLGATNTVTISVDQDSWIRDDQPSKEYSTDVKLHIRYEIGIIERSMYRYDLSAIPANSSILSATAWFYVVEAHAEGPVDIHAITADWTEADATWDSMGDDIGAAPLTSFPAQPVAGAWVAANLTSLVQAWVNGEDNFGITLNSTSEGMHAEFGSRESTTQPYLEVVIGIPTASPATLKAVATLGNGVTRTKYRDDVTLYQRPGTMLQHQPDAAEAVDAYIWAAYKNTNYGSDDETWVSTGATNESLALFKFDLDRLPAGARIDGAWLSAYHRGGNDINVPIGAHRITNPWVEDEVTWNNRDNSNTWDSPGSDYAASPVDTVLVDKSDVQRYEWDITRLVKGWVNGSYPNHGVVLRTDEPGTFGELFDTSDHADPTRHPRLNISYSCACGEVCVTPQGSGRIVMIGDWSGPSPDLRDLQKEAIIESWGYAVDQVDHDLIWSIDFNSYDLVYISETASSASVIGQVSWRSIGVVTEQGNLNFDLGLMDGMATTTGDTVEITDNSHFVTRPFTLGSLPIYDAEMEILTGSGNLGVDLIVLAEDAGDPSLMLLEAGTTGVNGPVPDRRVTLPLGRSTNSSFNWDYLNHNGRLLVLRAIEWGMGKDKGSIGNVLLVVVNPGSLTAQEDAKKSLIEGWDYTVNLIDESDSQANFDAAIAANDVAYISEDINSGTLGSKLRNAVIGVVNEEGEQVDELGFSTDKLFKNRHEIDVIDDTHYITQAFATGLLTFTLSDQSVHMLSSQVAPGLQALGQSFNTGSQWKPSLATLDSGDELSGGGAAAGRRVQLPWGGGSFDINQLNDNGRSIMQRSLEWAASLPNPSPMAHWKLDETTDFTAVDSEGGNDGTLTNGSGWTSGLFQGGLDFDGIDDYVDVGGMDVYGSGITMTGWFNAETIASDDPRIVSKASGSNEGDAWWQLSTTDSGANRYLRMRIKAGGTTTTFADSSVNLSAGQWYFAVGTYDNSSGDMKLYLDGVEVASGSHALGGAIAIDPSVPVAIGANGTAERFFNGILDDVRVYDRALSAGEIAELAVLPGPIAHWKLDDAPGSTAIDSVGGNDATLNGNPAWTTGVADNALEFDGSGDYATTDNDFAPPPAGTVSFWMKVPGSPTSHGRILGLDDTWEVRHVTTGTPDGIAYGLVFDLGVSGVNAEFVTTVTVDTPDQWYFVAATYDTNRDAYAVYLDGVLHKSGTYPSSLSVPAANPLSLGTRTGSGHYFDGTLDDVRLYHYVLPASAIADLYAANPPPGATSYTELYQPWSATSDDTWQTVDLGAFGVPADAVVEVAVVNSDTGKKFSGGVRAVGSSLERRFQLHEAEGNGVDAVTMHVQADASSQIQHYSDKKNRVSFIVLGYWTGATYVERFDAFKAGANASWQSHDLGAYGVGASQVAEIAMSQTSTSIEWLVGARKPGSGLVRRLPLHEAENGGIDMVTLMAGTDASSIVEVYAEANSVVDFHLLGYWSTPPGSYTETGAVHGQASVAASWQTTDLSGLGIPANSVAQFVMSNEIDDNENQMGLRESGSTIPDRRLDLQEAESGGGDLGTMHVKVDTSSQIQWFAEYGAGEGFFYPLGWWVLSP